MLNKLPSLKLTIPPCPICGATHCRRSRYVGKDNLIDRVFFNKFRCESCRARFAKISILKITVLSVTLIMLGIVGLLMGYILLAPAPVIQNL